MVARRGRFWMLGTHNSCHVASLFAVFVPYWRYTHATLEQQLGAGLRHIELDIWFDRGAGHCTNRYA